MIFDRTSEDVENAIKIRDEKIKQKLNLTAEDLAVLERGFFTLNTLNRIESKQAELKDQINALGYWNTPIYNVVWGEEGVFAEPDFNRIISNLTILKNAFFVFPDTPNNYQVNYKVENINAIEKALYDMGVMAEEVNALTKESGDFSAGE